MIYNDGQSAGVIERDESLAAMNGLAPVEYASRIMKSKADEAECLKIMDSFDQGHANVLVPCTSMFRRKGLI